MRLTLSTGQAARLLDTNEPRLADLVRKAKIAPPPEVVAGRRIWQREHVQRAAELLGCSLDQLRARLATLEGNDAS